MIWEILKIDPTKDKKAIKRAYRQQLTSVNPEEKPEEFKLLRHAYEEALAYADSNQEEARDKSPIELWVDRLTELYDDMARRISLNAWGELLSDNLALALDTRPLIEEAMLHFMMKHYRIPHAVWLYLDEEFHFSERAEELDQKYPKGFVPYVIMEGIQHEDRIPYGLFDSRDGRSCDAYMDTYFELMQTPFTEAQNLADRLSYMPVHHPYGDAVLARYKIYSGDKAALMELNALHDTYPKDTHLYIELAAGCYDAGQFDQSLKIANRILEKNPKHIAVLRIKAFSQEQLKNYKEAAETVNKIMNLLGGNERQLSEYIEILKGWNDKLIKQYEETLDSDPFDYDTIYNLGWAYIQNDFIYKAYGLLPRLKEDYPTRVKYLRLRYLILHLNGCSEEALNLMDALLLANLPAKEDSEEDKIKCQNRQVDYLVEKAQLLINLERKEEGMETLKEAQNCAFDNSYALTQLCHMYLSLKMYPEALSNANRITQLMPNSYHGYLLAARASFALHHDSDAFSAVNTAIDLEASDLYAYLLKLRILMRNDAFDAARDLISFLEGCGITDDPTLRWCQARLLSLKEENVEEAYKAYQDIEADLLKMDALPEWTPKFYYQMALLLAGVQDAHKNYDRSQLYLLLEKGLAADPDDFDCAEYKAWLMKRDKRIKESEEIYLRLEKYPRYNHYIESQLAEIYYDDIFHYGDKALKYYKILEEDQGGTRDYQLRMGYLTYITKDFEASENHYQKSLELRPDDAWTYHQLTNLFLVQRRFDQALTTSLKALECHKAASSQKNYRDFYWRELARVYIHKGMPLKAVNTYKECLQECSDYKYYWSDVYDTYFTAGLKDLALTHMAEWEKSGQVMGQWAVKKIYLLLLEGKVDSASKVLQDNRDKIDDYEFNYQNSLIMACKGDFSERCRVSRAYLTQRMKPSEEGNRCYAYSSYAFKLWMCDKFDTAKEMAQAGLKEYEVYQTKYDMSIPIPTGAISVCLAILGRADEGRRLLEKMKSSPMCYFCRFPICKDFYVYRSNLELVAGNYQEARHYNEEARKADPGEDVCLVMDSYLNLKQPN